MNILVIGSGGREHALLWKLQQSPLVRKLYCAPGNAGTAAIAENLPLDATDIDGLINAAKKRNIDLTVVGPEQPLTMGIADRFLEQGLPIFGPTQQAAELEGSKAFAKRFMEKYNIPTAEFKIFHRDEFNRAAAYVQSLPGGIVVKADGLAAGKGVMVCSSSGEAAQALDAIMKKNIFGDAGSTVVIEECLAGEEVSILALTDGKHFVTLAPSQDHKRILDNDRGKNTGGMGAYAPVPLVSNRLLDDIRNKIIRPTIDGMAREGRPYSGCLYAGLMLTDAGPKVIEYNCRFGDPETQAILPLLEDDLASLMLQVSRGNLEQSVLRSGRGTAVTVVLASNGYPDAYETGKKILGLETLRAEKNIIVFHAGTGVRNGSVVTTGGRVLSVTGRGSADDIEETIFKTYDAVKKITFNGAYYRGDIGRKGVLAARRMRESESL